MRSVRTDLALESSALQNASGALSGIRMTQRVYEDVVETIVDVLDERGAHALGRAIGRYVTLASADMPLPDCQTRTVLVERLRLTLCGMLPASGDVLVVGLGNRRVTADSLGPKVVDKMLVTRHMRDQMPPPLKGRLRSVSAVAPGVLGVTGMETAEVVRGIVENIRPAAVIAVDALAARETARICTTLQIADTGIDPGSGIGNHRMALNRETLGVPVIALGVPMVVYAATIARDALSLLAGDLGFDCEEHASALDALVSRVVAEQLGDMVVTPREVDERVQNIADAIALGVNRALQPQLSNDEFQVLTR
ncbi:MAG: GPR endopeptidase [Oscillospiraceae bacterium]|jgi:spore protease|nr:GPR endopeptidase [Oscillospiraceae bacterium]